MKTANHCPLPSPPAPKSTMPNASEDEPSCIPVRGEFQGPKGSPDCQTYNSDNPFPLWMSLWCMRIVTPYTCIILSFTPIVREWQFQGHLKILIEIHVRSTNPILSPNFDFGFINVISNSCSLPRC